MRHPNGYGTVYKRSGRLRKPWYAQKTVRWENGVQIVKTIGTYATRQDALRALAAYNGQPYDLDVGYTVSAVYNSYMRAHPKFTDSQTKAREDSYKHLREFYGRPFVSVRAGDWERVINEMDAVAAVKNRVKQLIREMYDFCIKKGMCIRNEGDEISLNDDTPVTRKEKKPMTMPQVLTMWEHQDDDIAAAILILIYSGMRIGEFCDLRREDVDLEQRFYRVKDAKTPSGIRTSPIAEVVLPLWERLQSDGEFFFTTPTGRPWLEDTFRRKYFKPYLAHFGMDYSPHEMRHTCITILQLAKVPLITIKQMVGHKKSKDLTDRVYTHIPLPALLEAADMMHPTVLKYASLTEV